MLENIQLGLIFGGVMLFYAIAIPAMFMGLCFLMGFSNLAKTIFSLLKWIFSLVFKNIKISLIVLLIYFIISIILVANNVK